MGEEEEVKNTIFFAVVGISSWITNGTNAFCFLSYLPLLPPATTAVFGSFLSSLYS